MTPDVVVVGAGPVGLMVALELLSAGLGVVVVEQQEAPSGESRALGFTRRTAEVLQQRGLLGRLGELTWGPTGHFAGARIDLDALVDDHRGVLGLSQATTEEVLEKRVLELGGRVRRGIRFSSLVQAPDSVRVYFDSATGPGTELTQYVVGCDGMRSRVRTVAGFDVQRWPATRWMYTAEVEGLAIRARPTGERLPGGSMVVSTPIGDGRTRIVIHDKHLSIQAPDAGLVTFAEVAGAWERLTGESLQGANPLWWWACDNSATLPHALRSGRVFLGGDAAHEMAPLAAWGLSVGIQDAANLGWKLAATIHGWAPPDLLDTYHAERHPLGQQLIRNAQAAVELRLSGDQMDPLREIVSELLTHHDAAEHLAGMLSGIGIRYDLAVGNHPLLGRRIPPDLPFSHNDETTTVQDLLTHCRGLLITPPGSPHAQQAKPWSDRIDIIEAHPNPAPHHHDIPSTSLIRPDGYIAWTDPDTTTSLTTALNRWFGKPRHDS